MYYLPDEEYRSTESAYRQDMIQCFMHSYLRTFGLGSATYTLHLILHLERIRAAGPFPEVSAIPFESNFAVLRRSFSLGTRSIPKQILSNLYMRAASGHHCRSRITVSDCNTVKTDNRFLYIYQAAARSYHFYKVKAVHGDGEVDVVTADISPTVFGLDKSRITWQSVGVFRLGFFGTHPTRQPLKRFSGKAIVIYSRSAKYILSVSPSILREK